MATPLRNENRRLRRVGGTSLLVAALALFLQGEEVYAAGVLAVARVPRGSGTTNGGIRGAARTLPAPDDGAAVDLAPALAAAIEDTSLLPEASIDFEGAIRRARDSAHAMRRSVRNLEACDGLGCSSELMLGHVDALEDIRVTVVDELNPVTEFVSSGIAVRNAVNTLNTLLTTVSTALIPLSAIPIIGQAVFAPIKTGVDGFKSGISPIKTALTTAYNAVFNPYNTAVTKTLDRMATSVETLGNFFDGVSDFADISEEQCPRSIFKAVIPSFETIYDTFESAVVMAEDGLSLVVDFLSKLLTALTSKAWNTIMTVVGDISSAIGGAMSTFGWIERQLSAVLDAEIRFPYPSDVNSRLVLRNNCPADKPNYSQELLKCFEGCGSGWSAAGNTCWTSCPGGYTDLGPACRNKYQPVETKHKIDGTGCGSNWKRSLWPSCLMKCGKLSSKGSNHLKNIGKANFKKCLDNNDNYCSNDSDSSCVGTLADGKKKCFETRTFAGSQYGTCAMPCPGDLSLDPTKTLCLKRSKGRGSTNPSCPSGASYVSPLNCNRKCRDNEWTVGPVACMEMKFVTITLRDVQDELDKLMDELMSVAEQGLREAISVVNGVLGDIGMPQIPSIPEISDVLGLGALEGHLTNLFDTDVLTNIGNAFPDFSSLASPLSNAFNQIGINMNDLDGMLSNIDNCEMDLNCYAQAFPGVPTLPFSGDDIINIMDQITSAVPSVDRVSEALIDMLYDGIIGCASYTDLTIPFGSEVAELTGLSALSDCDATIPICTEPRFNPGAWEAFVSAVESEFEPFMFAIKAAAQAGASSSRRLSSNSYWDNFKAPITIPIPLNPDLKFFLSGGVNGYKKFKLHGKKYNDFEKDNMSKIGHFIDINFFKFSYKLKIGLEKGSFYHSHAFKVGIDGVYQHSKNNFQALLQSSYDNLKLFWREYEKDGLLNCFEGSECTDLFPSTGYEKPGCAKVCKSYTRFKSPDAWIWEGKSPDVSSDNYKHAITDFVESTSIDWKSDDAFERTRKLSNFYRQIMKDVKKAEKQVADSPDIYWNQPTTYTFYKSWYKQNAYQKVKSYISDKILSVPLKFATYAPNEDPSRLYTTVEAGVTGYLNMGSDYTNEPIGYSVGASWYTSSGKDRVKIGFGSALEAVEHGLEGLSPLDLWPLDANGFTMKGSVFRQRFFLDRKASPIQNKPFAKLNIGASFAMVLYTNKEGWFWESPDSDSDSDPDSTVRYTACGSGESTSCSGDVERANETEIQAVRCCIDADSPPADAIGWSGNWVSHCAASDGIYGESAELNGQCLETDYNSAVDACSDEGGRLCTIDELHRGCAKYSGCGFDHVMVWAYAGESYGGQSCTSDKICINGGCNLTTNACTLGELDMLCSSNDQCASSYCDSEQSPSVCACGTDSIRTDEGCVSCNNGDGEYYEVEKVGGYEFCRYLNYKRPQADAVNYCKSMGLSLVQIRTESKQTATETFCGNDCTWLDATCGGDACQTDLGQWIYPDNVAVNDTYHNFKFRDDGTLNGGKPGETCAHWWNLISGWGPQGCGSSFYGTLCEPADQGTD